MHVRPEGNFEVVDKQGQTVWQSELATANVFPRLVREYAPKQPMPQLAEGEYTVRVKVTSPTTATVEHGLFVVDGRIELREPRRNTANR